MGQRKPFGRRHWAAFAALLLTLCGLYLTHPPGRFTLGGRASGDGVYYYAYTRSLVLDRDLDFTNDYALLGDPHAHGESALGRPENRFAIGTGLLLVPTFLVAHAVASTVDDPMDGSSMLHQRITLFGSVLFGFFAVLLSARLAAHFVDPSIATTAAIAIALASPLTWYTVYQPDFPHAASAFVVAAFVVLWYEGRQQRTLRGWIFVGALAGVAALVRTQNVVLLALPAFDLGRGIIGALRVRDAARLRTVIAATASMLLSAAVTFTPQIAAWSSIYGEALTMPQGAAFMRWSDSKWVEALFSSRNGLFSWTPLVGASIGGLFILGLRRRLAANTAGLLLFVFVAEAYINGSVDDWWGGWAYGGRRFVGCTICFVVGCAYLLHGLRQLAVTHASRLAAAGPVVVVALFASYNASFMWDYMHAELRRGESQPMEPATQRWAARAIAAWYRVLGHPGALPENLVHAWRAGVSPDHYDASSGWELATDRTRPRGWDQIYFHDPRWAGDGFGPRAKLAGKDVSWVRDAAVFMVPLRYPAALQAAVALQRAAADTRIRIEVGGHAIMDRVAKVGWRVYALSIPPEALHAGINYVAVTQGLPPPAPPVPRPIGRTGKKTSLEIEIVVDPDADEPLSFALDRTNIAIAERGVTVFALDDDPDADSPGYRALGTFDTAADVHAIARLAARIDGLAAGQPVALGLAHSALAHWGPDGDAVLARLGGAAQLKADGQTTRYALIGAVGAAPGTALEAVGEEGPLRIGIGRAASLRHEGVAWGDLVLWRSDVERPDVLDGQKLLPSL